MNKQDDFMRSEVVVVSYGLVAGRESSVFPSFLQVMIMS